MRSLGRIFLFFLLLVFLAIAVKYSVIQLSSVWRWAR